MQDKQRRSRAPKRAPAKAVAPSGESQVLECILLSVGAMDVSWLSENQNRTPSSKCKELIAAVETQADAKMSLHTLLLACIACRCFTHALMRRVLISMTTTHYCVPQLVNHLIIVAEHA